MNKKELKCKLKQTLDNSIPSEFDAEIQKYLQKKGNQIMKTKQKEKSKETRKTLIPKLSLALGVLLILIVTPTIYFTSQSKPSSYVDLDVNPSIELVLNKKEQVVEAIAKNEDAKEILKDMDLEKTDIDVALNAIIGSLVTNGYIDELSNSILISVENKDKAKAEELRKKLTEKIESIIGTENIEGSILSQSISDNKEAEKLAKKHHISTGKANLILELLAKDPLLKEEDLINMTINELNILSEEKAEKLNTIKKEGTASTKSYIEKNKAKEIALNNAGISNPENLKIKFDADDGKMVYEVEFDANNMEYEYEIDAKTGIIITLDKEPKEETNVTNSNNEPTNNNNTNNNFIGETKAKEIALKHANVTNPQNLRVELDREDNEYSIEFTSNNIEYEYEINAKNGNIIKAEKEQVENSSHNSNHKPNNNNNNNNNTTSKPTNNYISRDKAKSIALNHAGVSNPKELEIELDKEDNEYSVEFKSNNVEYEYEINATTGQILKAERD